MGLATFRERPRTQVRRRDRVLADDEWLDRLLEKAALGHLAVTHDGQPMIHSNIFWYDGSAVFVHMARVGRLRAVLELGDATACFTVAEMGRILPAGTPLDFSVEYASAVLYGRVGIVAGRTEQRYALEGLMTKYAPQLTPGEDYVPMPDTDIAQTTVLKLTVDERVGKHNVKPADYPAYAYPGESFIDAERAAGRETMAPKDVG